MAGKGEKSTARTPVAPPLPTPEVPSLPTPEVQPAQLAHAPPNSASICKEFERHIAGCSFHLANLLQAPPGTRYNRATREHHEFLDRLFAQKVGLFEWYRGKGWISTADCKFLEKTIRRLKDMAQRAWDAAPPPWAFGVLLLA
jgi:hypothetical protein